MYVYIYVCMYICMYFCMYVWMFVYIYIYIYINIHIASILSTVIGSDPTTAFLEERNVCTLLDWTMLRSASRRCRLEPQICCSERENTEKTLVVGGGVVYPFFPLAIYCRSSANSPSGSLVQHTLYIAPCYAAERNDFLYFKKYSKLIL